MMASDVSLPGDWESSSTMAGTCPESGTSNCPGLPAEDQASPE